MAFLRRSSTPTKPPPIRAPLAQSDSSLESDIHRIGADLLDAARGAKSGVFSRKFWSDQLMDWSMKDPAFKVQLFRFVDVFPTLTTPQLVHDHLIDYLSQPGVSVPPAMALGLKAGGLLKGVFAKTVAGQITGMAEKFIAGVDAPSALPQLRRLWDSGLAFSVDLLGEACVSDEEADVYRNRYLELIETLPKQVADWPDRPALQSDHLGPIPRVNVSVKISSLYARTSVIDFDRSLDGLTDSVMPILRAAKAAGVFVNFDMEQFSLKDLTIALFQRCCEKLDFQGGIAIQAYLRTGPDDAQRLIDWSHKTGRQIVVRLIKGAYWDYETLRAEQLGWPCPVWSHKWQTDACIEHMARLFVDAIPTSAGQGGIKLALGSHNVRSIAAAQALVARRNLPPNALELQMLHGMADELKAALAPRGVRLREYVPVGQMIPGMAYLVRRLLENTSNESWLRAGFRDDASIDSLLANPAASAANTNGHSVASGLPVDLPSDERAATADKNALSDAPAGVGDSHPFFNEPPRDFSRSEVRAKFAAAIAAARVESVPNDATVDQARAAVGKAAAAFPAWRDSAPLDRAKILVAAAAEMRRRRDELSAIVLLESGKPWAEADADLCEAIDFCEFYARESPRFFASQRLGRLAGESDELIHEPRGVAVVISPWNFPLAICCGMVVAALATGNTVVVKPAEQTPGIAREFCRILWKAGIPADALQFLAGPGETVGAALVRDPRIALIAFTGSKAVGLDIIAAAGITDDSQPFVKRVVCEMGGKNAVIIDDSADLDEAVLGVRYSAFGYCGQKCSAASRVIALAGVHDAFLRRLVEATRALAVGDMRDPGTDLGPVIDAEAAAKIRRYIELGKQESALALAMEPPTGLSQKISREFVGPHIFRDVKPDHRIAREEIFGPVLAVMRAADFDEAIRFANSSPYKLTGGVFSRTPSHLDQARREFRVGNLYLNRGITGALVGRQPFGGFGLSGVGSKAGGREYLLQFVNPRSITENTMRRGFAPEL